jgi:hypothetical protein
MFDAQVSDLRQERIARIRRKLFALDVSPNANALHRSQRSQRPQRFCSLVIVRPDGCWEWKGTRKSAKQGGYPMFIHKHAVGWAYENFRGLPAPQRGSGLELVHQDGGDNPVCKLGSECVHPNHVEPGTHKENMGNLGKEAHKRRCAMMRRSIKPSSRTYAPANALRADRSQHS